MIAELALAAVLHGPAPHPHATAPCLLLRPSQAADCRWALRTRVYTTVRGDSLRSVARMIYGDTHAWQLIARANGLHGHPARKLPVGTVLVLPRR